MKSCLFKFSTPPPSVNRATAPVGGKQLTVENGRFAVSRGKTTKRNSKEYRAWIDMAGKELMCQRGKLPELCYWKIRISVPRALTGADIGNLEKALPDLLVKHRRVPDDRYCVYTSTRFSAGKQVEVLVEQADLETWLPIMKPGKDLERRLRKADNE